MNNTFAEQRWKEDAWKRTEGGHDLNSGREEKKDASNYTINEYLIQLIYVMVYSSLYIYIFFRPLNI